MKHGIVTRGLTGALSAVSVLALLAGCSSSSGSAASGSPTSGGTLVFAVETDPSCIDPQQASVTQALYIGRQVVDSLIDQDPDTGDYVPWLASSYETNADLTQFTFTLRDDVTFSDGTALTGQVVKDNFDSLVQMSSSGSTATLAAQYLSGYQGTEVDGNTVTVTFSSPNATFLNGASTMSLGIVSEATTQQSAEDRCQNGVTGTGPFVYDSYETNSSVTMNRREGYDWASELRQHQGDAYLDRVEFEVITEDSVRTGGLESGEFDMIGEVPYDDESQISDDGYSIYAKANPGVPTSLIPNLDHSTVLADANVRQAIQLGIDRDEITSSLGYADGNAPTSALSSATSGYTSEADLLSYDPDQAKQILDDDGWTVGDDGIREKDGQKLTFTVTGFYEQDMIELIQMELKEIGVDMEINFTDSTGFFSAISTGDYDMLFAALTRTDPDVLRVMFSQESTSHWAVVHDDQLETLLTDQASDADQSSRYATLADAQQRIIEQNYLFPILEVYQLHASQSSITGFAFDSASKFDLYDVSKAS